MTGFFLWRTKALFGKADRWKARVIFGGARSEKSLNHLCTGRIVCKEEGGGGSRLPAYLDRGSSRFPIELDASDEPCRVLNRGSPFVAVAGVRYGNVEDARRHE